MYLNVPDMLEYMVGIAGRGCCSLKSAKTVPYDEGVVIQFRWSYPQLDVHKTFVR